VTGVIEGGWEFVWAAYAVTTIVFLGYTGSVLARYRKERKRDRESARE
jgi:heme exporter protein D